MSTKWFGAPVRRREDVRLLQGQGQFLDDLKFPDMAHVWLLRSPHARARIGSVDVAGALAAKNVIAAYTHSDLGNTGDPFPQLLPHPKLLSATWSALAPGHVSFAGEAIAAVVAETAADAMAGVEALIVDWHELPAAIDLESAIGADAPRVHEHVQKNVAMRLVERRGDVEAALRNARHRIKERFRVTRGTGFPMEPRGVVAEFDKRRNELTVWSSTQEPHTVRNVIADLLGLARHRVRVIAPDTGGGFGTKVNVYPEEVLIPWLAIKLGRPIKWVEGRGEHMLASTHEREQINDIEIAFDETGAVHGFKSTFLHDMGAYAPRGIAVPHNTCAALAGPYKIPNFQIEMVAVYTNTGTVSAYRGAGQPQGVFAIERIFDRVAKFLNRDPAEIRLLNMISAEQLPYDTGLTNLTGGSVEYDSGDFIATLNAALTTADYAGLRARQREARKAGRYFGIGIANYVELTGRGPWEGAGVRVEPNGTVTIYTGAPSQGQGLDTTLAQICADSLGVDLSAVNVMTGDTSIIAHGIGTFASRIAVLGGNAVQNASQAVRAKILRIAEKQMEVGQQDLDIADGRVFVVGIPGHSLSFSEIAQIAWKGKDVEEDPGLDATHYFKAPRMAYANGTHIAAVEVDVDIGAISVIDYIISHDCGRVINPMIVHGQIDGGFACGFGNAVMEKHVYSSDGQLMTGSLMDYALPRASDVPHFRTVHQETPCTLNPLGVKGVGEAGTIPVPAAICSAVEDALLPLGVSINEHPLTQSRLWELCQTHR